MRAATRLGSLAEKLSNWKESATIYVHWPYCLKRCSYCNFNKYIKENVDHKRMEKCLTAEVETLLHLTEVKKIKSVYFGGGTPSLALPSTVSAVLEKISSLAELGRDAEITIECNPTQLESERLKSFKVTGVNRVSIGLQALNDKDLKVLGRTHSSSDSKRCFEFATSVFPDNVSIDVIFGRPNQTLSSWQEELEQILSICGQHVSLYQLTLERGTELFKQVQKNEVVLPEYEEVTDMYLLAVEMFEDHNFHRYEASNFAKKGAESEHNLSYWNGTQYIGIGPGAHGRFHCHGSTSALREARIQTLEPDVWMTEVENRGHGTRKIVPQQAADVLKELMMTSMRTADGLKNENWTLFSNGATVSEVFQSWPGFRKLVEDGLCFLRNGDLVPTRKGMTLADTLTVELLPAIK